MSFIKFEVEPIVVVIESTIFYLTPHYIIESSRKGSYINTYKASVFLAGLAHGSWTETIENHTWRYTRVDGMPDRRYSYNPMVTYNTYVEHPVNNMLGLILPGYELKYEINNQLRDEVINCVRAYASTVVLDNYDPVHHVLRLLKACNPGDNCIRNIENIIKEK